MIWNISYSVTNIFGGEILDCYFDNSATTKVCEHAVKDMLVMLTGNYGNPASLHKKGDEAQFALNKSRANIARKLSCQSEEVYFTSGGTESNNIAIFGTAEALKRRGKRIVTTSIEHPSVSEPLKRLESQGFEIIRLPVGIDGKIKEENLYYAVNQDTILVSIMYVNNEVGSIQPINAIKTAIKRVNAPALIHCDAVQAFCKLPIIPSELGVDLLSISSHKIHGPKGAGAIYIKKGIKIVSHTCGGGQEDGVRSGTHAMPSIVGFGSAVADYPYDEQQYKRMLSLRNNFLNEVSAIEGVYINSPDDALPYIINISVEGIPSEVMRNYLSERDIFVSSGSACSRGHRSIVLSQMGLPISRIDSALRISLSRFTTQEEMEILYKNIKAAVVKLR